MQLKRPKNALLTILMAYILCCIMQFKGKGAQALLFFFFSENIF